MHVNYVELHPLVPTNHFRLKRRNSASCWNFSDPPTHTIETVDTSKKLAYSGETRYRCCATNVEISRLLETE